MSSEISNSAYKYAAGIYLLFGAYAWYVFFELGGTVGRLLPSNVRGFSVDNPNFLIMNRLISAALALVLLVILFASESLKNYIVDVGDELTRVSWADLKETQKSTAVVLGLCIVSSIFLFVADQVFLKVINWIFAFAA